MTDRRPVLEAALRPLTEQDLGRLASAARLRVLGAQIDGYTAAASFELRVAELLEDEARRRRAGHKGADRAA